MRRFLIFVASLAFLPAMVHAQGRGGGGRAMGGGMAHPAVAHTSMGGSTMAHPAMAAPHSATRPSLSSTSHFAYGSRAYSGARYVRTRSGAIVAVRQSRTVRTGRSSRPLLSEDVVPGLGFDSAHVAAVHPHGPGDRGRGRGRDRGFVGAYFPFYGGDYYWPLDSDDAGDEEVSAAPADETQPVEAGESEADQVAENEIPATPSRDYVPAKSIPPQASDEYVFVRRDGTLFFATAFAWENGTLRYITREGLRHTMSLDQLDLNATQQFNQQRGLIFRMPA